MDFMQKNAYYCVSKKPLEIKFIDISTETYMYNVNKDLESIQKVVNAFIANNELYFLRL